MYKPCTQLILTDLWAADAADKLGFEVDTYNHLFQKWESWFVLLLVNDPFSDWVSRARKWRITVTESGPNAAERFLPQVRDWAEDVNGNWMMVTEILADDPRWIGNARQTGIHNPFTECRRIIERNSTPFPQFSEVIEP